MASAQGLNRQALDLILAAMSNETALRTASLKLDCGAHVLDFGIHQQGGLAAGVQLASICLGGAAGVSIANGMREIWPGPWIQVATDHPIRACLFGQYAGWPVRSDQFFAMGSGAMRVHRGKENVLTELGARDDSPVAVGVLECDTLPSDALALDMARECNVACEALWLAVAPIRSIAGCVQVVARSIETSLHKLHELGFPLAAIQQAYGIAPLPPPSPDFVEGIGRTNDAILYGGYVTLWVDVDDKDIENLGPKVPSLGSPDFGQPFGEIFKRYNGDFYSIDPGLFSPAEVVFHNVRTGRSWRFGQLRADLIVQSFAVG